ncbi:endo-alpha-N-acetylgalactosaminidase family protein [Halocatena halophila]|uniref:endo-alpha-N-acetylgalactosaminidase family protein n=1 Tax=Halocatena halophila TaxID=2814576 RepID=UPI002ED57DCB
MTANRRNFLKVVGLGFASSAFGAQSANAATPSTATIESSDLSVTVATDFPRIIEYAHTPTGGLLYGTSASLSTLLIDGTEYTPSVSSTVRDGAIEYRLAVPSIAVTIDCSIRVSGSIVAFTVTDIQEGGSRMVHTLEIPEHNLVSVRDSQPDATLAATDFSVDGSKNGDYVVSVADGSVQSSPDGSPYAFVSTDTVAAGVETNAFGPLQNDEGQDPDRLAVQTVDSGSYKRTGIWSQPWRYRESDTDDIVELPWAKVAIAGDKNGDGTVNWQDGAIAFREIMYNPPGVEETKKRVAQYITHNFGSTATTPFLAALDGVKRAYLVTDGLGQFIELKGYQSEGHDSAHPDYGGNYNRRAGGREDLRTLIQRGEAFNAEFGVHLNATESYPEATGFDGDLVDFDSEGWRWLDQSYYNDHHYDLTSGRLQRRLEQLRSEVPEENLSFIYLDVYYANGWNAYKTATLMHDLGWDTTTEFPQTWERFSVWSHWATDIDYGPDSSRGINSTIIRFIRFHQKDVFVGTELLPVPEMVGWQGWSGEHDFTQFVETVFDRNLPIKFLKHHEIVRWTDDTVTFTDDVELSNASGRRTITRNDRTVYDDGAYLLQWSANDGQNQRLYHWNPDGGETTWELPAPPWRNKRWLECYKLTDTGRVHETTLQPSNGSVTIDAEAGTPYVVYCSRKGGNPDK